MMPTMPPDSRTISLKIIEAIKQHPVLYINDVKGITVKVQEFRQKVWKRISDELTLDPTYVRLRWKNLRDTYCRILKYKNKTEKGGRRKKWVFEDHLNFLKFPYESDYEPQCVELTPEYIQDINSTSISTEELLEQLEDKNEEDYSEYLEVLEETTADPITFADNEVFDSGFAEITERLSENEARSDQQQDIDKYAQHIQSKYRKIQPKSTNIDDTRLMQMSNSYSVLKGPPLKTRRLNNANANEPISITPLILTGSPVVSLPSTATTSKTLNFKESTTDDSKKNEKSSFHGKHSTELFFNSMAQTVKLLPLKAQVEIKMAVCKIVTEAEVKYSASNLSKNTQQFVTPPGMIPKLVLVPCSMIDNPGK